MFSAAGFWDGYRWRRVRFFTRGLKFLDCGGFTLLNRFGDYPFSRDAYQNLIAFLRPDHYAAMDYPCEPEITRGLGLSTNRERIEMTVQNARWFLDNHNLIGCSIPIPVIQGYTLDEYRECIDLHHQTETIRDYMAVGSMCRRLSVKELHILIPGIFEYAQQAGAKHLHWFGLKLSPSLDDLREYIYSRDSAVALDDYDPALRAERGGRRWPVGQAEKRAVFERFFLRLESLGLAYK